MNFDSVTTLAELVAEQAARHGERLLFRFLPSRTVSPVDLTFAGLARDAANLGSHLREYAKPGDRALLLYPAGLDFIRAFFACQYAGIIPAPAYPPVVTRRENAFGRMRSILTSAEPTLVLGTKSICDSLSQNEADWRVDVPVRVLATDTLPVEPAAWNPAPSGGTSLGLLQYTSGSTGDPRGVMVSQANLLHNLQLIQDAFGSSPDMIGVFWLPFHHDMGLIGSMLSTLYCGGTATFFAPIEFVQRPYRWLELISNLKATVSGGPNFAYDECVRRITPEQRSTLDLSSWQLAFCGSEPVKRDTLRGFTETFASCGFRAEAFYPCYGLAESTLMVTGPRRESRVQSPEPEKELPISSSALDSRLSTLDSKTDRVPCGVPRGGLEVLIVDPESLRPVDEDAIGEIWVSGGSVAQGYWNRPDETERVFHGRLADGRGPYLRTGDLGFFHQGELYITGRLKDLIIICGRNLSPEDVEVTVARCHTALRASAAFSIDEHQGEALVVVAEVDHRALGRDNGNPAAAEASQVVNAIRRAVFDAHEVSPRRVMLVKALSVPRTTSGKIRRGACRELYLASQLDEVSISG